LDIYQKVTFSDEDKVDDLLKEIKIEHKISPLPGGKGGYLIHLDIDESHSAWHTIETLIKEKQAVDMYDTSFSESELRSAEWVRFRPSFEHGYPQPENGWDKITYEKECPRCGAGFRQKAPFHIAKEPRMGKNNFLSLYWTETAFCTQKALEALKNSGIKGYEVWPAILHKFNKPSDVISQLILPYFADPGLADEDKLEPWTCPVCGLTKYAYHKRGYMHIKRQALRTDLDCQLTYEWFGGGGHMGWREMLISNRFVNLILDQGWKGLRLKPVKVV
jgi:rubredoxin